MEKTDLKCDPVGIRLGMAGGFTEISEADPGHHVPKQTNYNNTPSVFQVLMLDRVEGAGAYYMTHKT